MHGCTEDPQRCGAARHVSLGRMLLPLFGSSSKAEALMLVCWHDAKAGGGAVQPMRPYDHAAPSHWIATLSWPPLLVPHTISSPRSCAVCTVPFVATCAGGSMIFLTIPFSFSPRHLSEAQLASA